MDFDIHPNRGAGPVVFGMTRDEVRACLGAPKEEFVRDPTFAPGWVEWIYGESEVFVTFDPSGKCAAVMLCPPGDARLEGASLLRVPGVEAWAVLRRLDPTAVVDVLPATGKSEGSLTSKRLGVCVYAPDVGTEWEDEAEPPQSVLVFREDYYDSE